MPHRKKFFTKNNSVKFLLLRGNQEAVNADGKSLEQIFVPISRNYKAGTSLLMANISALDNSVPAEDTAEEPDLKKIMDGFDDSDSEIAVEDLPSKMKKLSFSEKSGLKLPHDGDEERNDFIDGQFSDASDDSYESDIGDDDIMMDPNCPEPLKMFNAKFEKVLEQYDDDQIGPLDDEDICGYLSTSSKRVTDLIDAVEHNKEEEIVLGDYDEDIKHKILGYAEDTGDEKIVEIVTENPIEFDCESILSTYSNKYNHPTVIKEERIRKIQIPNNPLKKQLTKSQLKTLSNEIESNSESDDDLSVSTAFNIRVKDETPEQRRERKNLFKEAKRESRILKKENKLAFKKEKKIKISQTLNAQCNAGIRLL